jgi:hypothetical protein
MSLLCLNFVSQKMTESTLAAEFVPKAEWITKVYTKIPSKSTRVGRVVCAGTQSATSVGPAGQDFAACRDLCATGLIKPVAILSRLHTRFTAWQ